MKKRILKVFAISALLLSAGGVVANKAFHLNKDDSAIRAEAASEFDDLNYNGESTLPSGYIFLNSSGEEASLTPQNNMLNVANGSGSKSKSNVLKFTIKVKVKIDFVVKTTSNKKRIYIFDEKGENLTSNNDDLYITSKGDYKACSIILEAGTYYLGTQSSNCLFFRSINFTSLETKKFNYNIYYNCDEITNPDTTQVEENSKLILPSEPSRIGYIFAGWYTDESCTIKAVEGTLITADISLYAMWVEQNYIAFKDGDETIKYVNFDKGSTISLTLPDTPTKDGYNFLGWFDDNDVEAKGGMEVSSTVTYNAKWERILVGDVMAQLGLSNVTETAKDGTTMSKVTTLESILPGENVGDVGRGFVVGTDSEIINNDGYNSDGYFEKNTLIDSTTFDKTSYLMKLERANENDEFYIQMVDTKIQYLNTTADAKLYISNNFDNTDDFLWTVTVDNGQFMFNPKGIAGDSILIRIGNSNKITNSYTSTKGKLPYVYAVDDGYEYSCDDSTKASTRFSLEFDKDNFDTKYLNNAEKADDFVVMDITVSQGNKKMNQTLTKGQINDFIANDGLEVINNNYEFGFIVKNVTDFTNELSISIVIKGFNEDGSNLTKERTISIKELATATSENVTGNDKDMINAFINYLG